MRTLDCHIIQSFIWPFQEVIFKGYFFEIDNSKFHNVEMIRDRTEADLIETLAFQTSFAKGVYKVWEAYFQDNGIISCFKI